MRGPRPTASLRADHRDRSPRAWIALILSILVLAPTVQGGSPSEPEVTDRSNDQMRQYGDLVTDGARENFSEVDILRAWIDENTTKGFRVHVETFGNISEEAFYNISFVLKRGPESVFESTASPGGVRHMVSAHGENASLDGVNLTTAGNRLTFDVDPSAIKASGGDIINELAVETRRIVAGDLPELPQAGDPDRQEGNDTAPDEGTSREYVISRTPVVSNIVISITGGEVEEGPETNSFTGGTAHTLDRNATVTFDVTVSNSGSDTESVALSVSGGEGLGPRLRDSVVEVQPSSSVSTTLKATLQNATPALYSISVQGSTPRGATGAAIASIAVETPEQQQDDDDNFVQPPVTTPDMDEEREVIPAGLEFLTPAAEAIKFDASFGSYAELALLIFLILLLVLITLILIALVRRGWVSVYVEPKKAVAAPGETVEFRLRVHNLRKNERIALARFERDGVAETLSWRTGIHLGREDGELLPTLDDPDADLEVPLAPRDAEGDHYMGLLRLRIPRDANKKDRGRIKFQVVPLTGSGKEKPGKGAQIHVDVRVDPDAHAKSPVRVGAVEHIPERPVEGDSVTTSATLTNNSREQLDLEVALMVDDATIATQQVSLPPQEERPIVFEWQAGAGTNKVRIQVFEQAQAPEGARFAPPPDAAPS